LATVWFYPFENGLEEDEIAAGVIKLYKKASFASLFQKNDLVAAKIHFGEKRNDGHINASWIKPLLAEIKKNGAKIFLTDTNTLYQGERQNSVDHLLLAYSHGFSIESLGVPIIIADGLVSRNFSEVAIEGKHFKSVKIANDILFSDALVVLSHLTGHILSGFGGAIKNLAMGCAPRSGKQLQHTDIIPKINAAKCKACERCIRICPQRAIHLENNIATIDYDLCYGCAECITICRNDAISYNLGKGTASIQEKMAEYAFGAVKDKKGKVCYFNFLTHITRECDCLDKAQKPIVNDIGILASFDPVAIDSASLDLLKEKAGEDILAKLLPGKDYNIQLNHAQEIGLGERKYELDIN